MRIQTNDSSPAVDVLNRGLDNLISVTDHALSCFEQQLKKKEFLYDENAEF